MSTVYSLCDRTHRALYPWHLAGFDCIAVDTQPAANPDDGITHWQCDIFSLDSLPNAVFVLAFPPCTDLCSSGSRWWAAKGQDALTFALLTVGKCIDLIGSTRGVLENPIGRLSTYYRRPDTKVDPFEFDGLTVEDNAYTKKTCLWLFNGAAFPRKHGSGIKPDDRIHRMSPADRSNRRSETPQGLANAIFMANVRYQK